MKTFTRDLGFVNYNELKDLAFVNFNGVTVYEAFKILSASGVPPITLQKCKGADLVDYKIYGNSIQNGTPTPDEPIEIESVGDYDEETGKYKIPITVRGKNLIEPSILNTDTSTYRYKYLNRENTVLVLSITDKDTSVDISGITFGFTANGKNAQDGYRWIITNGQVLVGSKPNNQLASGQKITPMQYISCHPNNEETWTKIFQRFNVQVEEGTKETDFAQYIEPITTNIYLKEPLRKIGSYADYIDFEEGKVVRNIVSKFINEVNSISSNPGTYKTFLTTASHTPLITYGAYNTPAYSYGYAVSNKFQQSEYRYNQLGNHAGLIQSYITTNGGNRVAYTFDDSSITTVAQAQEKIGDGFEVNYVLETPIEEEMELPNIPTFKGTTIIEVDTLIQSSNMEVEYYGKE